MIRIKICGITNLDDALACAEAGADLLGFNFYSGSSRYIAPEAARSIVQELPPAVIRVGLFVNAESLEFIKTTVETAQVDVVQLHGEESPEFCQELRAVLPEHPLIKALRVGPDFNPQKALLYQAEAILLDSYDEAAQGGTGKTFDWNRAWLTGRFTKNVFVAGGLSPENVAEAIAVFKPFGVDACSKLETAPGQKDMSLVKAFVAAVRAAEAKHAV